MPASDFRPRDATLRYAAEAGNRADIAHSNAIGLDVVAVLGSLANTIGCGLVYIGDQLGREPEPTEREIYRDVRVVKIEGRSVLLEVAGERSENLMEGDTLRVSGLRLTGGSR